MTVRNGLIYITIIPTVNRIAFQNNCGSEKYNLLYNEVITYTKDIDFNTVAEILKAKIIEVNNLQLTATNLNRKWDHIRPLSPCIVDVGTHIFREWPSNGLQLPDIKSKAC